MKFKTIIEAIQNAETEYTVGVEDDVIVIVQPDPDWPGIPGRIYAAKGLDDAPEANPFSRLLAILEKALGSFNEQWGLSQFSASKFETEAINQADLPWAVHDLMVQEMPDHSDTWYHFVTIENLEFC